MRKRASLGRPFFCARGAVTAIAALCSLHLSLCLRGDAARRVRIGVFRPSLFVYSKFSVTLAKRTFHFLCPSILTGPSPLTGHGR